MKLIEIEKLNKIHITMKQIKFTIMQIFTRFTLLLGILPLFLGCSVEDKDVFFTGDEYQNILQFIDSDPENFSSFRQIIEVGHLTDVLSSYNSNVGGKGFTLFLPDNDAVVKFIDDNPRFNSFEELLKDTVFAKELVKYHVVNAETNSVDFPNGALPDKTLSDDFITIIFNDEGNEIVYTVNNYAVIVQRNIEKSNGTIHLIDKMLLPVVYTGYEWVQSNKNNGYGIFAELLEITGLEDTLNYFEYDELNFKDYSEYTLFVESDALYSANGINSIDDLNRLIGTEDSDYTKHSNKLNKFARYHVLSSSIFLDKFKTGLEATYGDYPIAVQAGLDLKFNIGSEVFDIIIKGEDTTHIDYLLVDLSSSNKLTKSGAIHQLNHILHPFVPQRNTVAFQFYEEPEISKLRNVVGSTPIRKEDLKYIGLFGIDYLFYTQLATNATGVNNNDYLTLTGNFEFTYNTPRILGGEYEVSITAHRDNRYNAMLEIYVDGEKIGGIIDLTSGSTSGSGFPPDFVLGNVEFIKNERHNIKIVSLVPGRLLLDKIVFKPVNN
jgi:uncharacterized surface protein with fasciclin (FAS1) repeats